MARKEIHLLNHFHEGVVEAGCDEAGRGPLAGPVFAAAVILPEGFSHPLLNDSKKMSRKAREEVRAFIEENAVAWAVEQIDAAEIDRLNILKASITAMQRAALRLNVRPEHLLIDGNRFLPFEIPYTCVVKGDGKYAPIAAASVLAKTYRDEYMEKIAAEFPEYGWERNMGYPTAEHIEAVMKYGLSPYHRRSFHLKALEPTLF